MATKFKNCYVDKESEIIVKDKEHVKILRDLEFYNSPVAVEAREASQSLIDKIDARFHKEMPMGTKREIRRAKRKKRSMRYLEVGSLNFKKMFKFLAVFFAVLIVGATICWAILATRKLKIDGYFTAQAFETATSGGITTSEFVDVEIKDLTAKKPQKSDVLQSSCILYLKEQEGALGVATVKFKAKVVGEGAITLKFEYFDEDSSMEIQRCTLKNNGYSVVDGTKVVSYQVDVLHNFAELNQKNYLKISIENQENITSLVFYGLKIVRM